MAKTDLPTDGNGTGGVTITGVSDTTNYQYHGTPDLVVTEINGVPVKNTSVLPPPPPPLPGSKDTTPEEYGRNYANEIRKRLNMPNEWFACKASDDCVTVHVPCNTGLAVSRKYKNEAENLICRGECVDVCKKSNPDTSRAICNNEQCATIIEPYKPR